jgi:hypothetical protein
MALIQAAMTGKNLTYVRLTTQTLADDGSLTPATGYLLQDSANFFGVVDGIEFFGENRTENISATWDTQTNHVVTKQGYGVTLTEILRAGAGLSLLGGAYYQSQIAGSGIVFVEIYRAVGLHAFYGVMASYTETFTEGKMTGRLTCRATDATLAAPWAFTTGASNP